MTPRGLVLSVAGLIGLLLAAPSMKAQTSRADSAKSYLERGGAWLKKGEFERAISDFDLAIATDRQFAAAWYNRGIARYRQGDRAGALGNYNQALQLAPRRVETLLNRGVVLLEQGDFSAARRDFDAIIEINPRHARAYLNRGIVREQAGDAVGALADFTQAINLERRLHEAWAARCGAHAWQGQLAAARADCEHALKLAPDNTEALVNRGALRQAQGDLDGALADFSRALALAPRVATIWNNRGRAWLLKDNYERALADLMGLRRPKKERKLPQLLPEAELKKFFRVIQQCGNLQHEIMLKLLFFTAVRVSELVRIKVSDIDFAQCRIFVKQGKGQKDRYILFPASFRLVLQSHLRANPKNRYLFETTRCMPFTTRRVQQIVKQYRDEAGIAQHVHPHLFRHQMITYLTARGLSDSQIQLISGHESKKSLEVYQHLSLKNVEQAYQETVKTLEV